MILGTFLIRTFLIRTFLNGTLLVASKNITVYFPNQSPLIDGDWIALQSAPGPDNTLRFAGFEPDDAGIYQCHVSHRCSVMTVNGPAPGIYAPAFRVEVSKGSIWIKSVKPESQKLPNGTREVTTTISFT